MIVTCENCDARFNLDENLIKESGSKVKCSKCNQVVTVYKPVAVEEPEPTLELEEDLAGLVEAEPEQLAEKAVGVAKEAAEKVLDFDLADPEEKPAEEEPEFEGLALEEETAPEKALPPEEEPQTEADISLAELLGLEEEPVTDEITAAAEEPLAEEPPPDEEISLDELVLEKETAPEETLAEEESSLDELGLEEEPTTEETVAGEKEVFLEEKVAGEEIVSEELEPEQEIAPEEIPEAKEPEPVIEEAVPPPVAKEALQARKRKRISTPVMILLALGLLAGGAFGAYTVLKSFDVQIPFLETLTGAPESATIDPGNLRIALLDQLIRSEFVENSTAGRLVVIKGKVRNDYPEARNFIMVRAVVYAIDGKLIQRKTAYCGNTLSDSDLQTLDKATIDAKLRNKFGDERSSCRVPSGKVIPFVVVFSDLPDELGEFSVSVVSSVAG
jgi:predicted Zn finger-like uncharacterized protein